MSRLNLRFVFVHHRTGFMASVMPSSFLIRFLALVMPSRVLSVCRWDCEPITDRHSVEPGTTGITAGRTEMTSMMSWAQLLPRW